MNCGKCVYYSLQFKAIKKVGVPAKELAHGHCLKRTKYASNSANRVPLPPHAVEEILPYGQHQISVVYAAGTEPNCPYAKEK